MDWKINLSPTARLDADDRVVEEYIYGTRINVPDYIIKDGAKYRVITDHRGSVRFVVDTHSGEVMQETEYTEFGQIISENLAEDWEPVIFGYAGGLQDRDTGLIRFGARDYDPETARWTSKEPLGFNGANNFYVYAENDPVNFVDPTGKIAIIPFLGVVAAGAAVNVWINYDRNKSFSEQFGDLAVKAVIGGSAAGAGFFSWWASVPTAALVGGMADLTNQFVGSKKGENIDWRSVGMSGTTAASGAIVGNIMGGICHSEAAGAFVSVGVTGLLDYNRDSALGWSGDMFNDFVSWAQDTMSPIINKSQNSPQMEGTQ